MRMLDVSRARDLTVLVYRLQARLGWTQVAELSSHTDQVTGLAISSDTRRLCVSAWDGRVSIWCLGIDLNCQTLETYCSW